MKTNYLYIFTLAIVLTAIPTYTMEQSLIATTDPIINYTQLPTNNLNIKEQQQIISPQTTTVTTPRPNSINNYEETKNWIISSNKRETIVNYPEDSQQENEYLKRVLTQDDLNTKIIHHDHNQTCFKALKCVKNGYIPAIVCLGILGLLATFITFIAEDPCWYNKTMHCSPFK